MTDQTTPTDNQAPDEKSAFELGTELIDRVYTDEKHGQQVIKPSVGSTQISIVRYDLDDGTQATYVLTLAKTITSDPSA